MTGAETAAAIERQCTNYDAIESAWRADLKNKALWDSFTLAKCRLADVTRGNLPAILAALRSERPASDVQGAADVERWFDIGFAAARELSDLDGSAQKDDRYPAWRQTKIRAALAAAQEG